MKRCVWLQQPLLVVATAAVAIELKAKKDVASGLDLCFDDARILCTATDARIKRIRERNAGFTKLTSDEFDTLLSMVGDDISRSRTFSLLLMAHSR